MKKSEREIDAVDCSEPETFMAGAVDCDVVEEDSLQFVDGPWSEEDP